MFLISLNKFLKADKWFEKNKINETNLLKQITEKYGDGQLDLKTGSYIKN